MRFHPVKLVVFLGLGCFLSLTWFTSVPNGGEAESEVLALYERLLLAERHGKQLTTHLRTVLEQMANLSRALNSSATDGDPFLRPNIQLYLPHLKEHPRGLTPNVLLGQGRRGVSLVLGIPTVKREKQSYLVSTLTSLLYDLTPSQRQDLLIVTFVAETDMEYVRSIAETIRTNFPKDAVSGLLEVVSPPEHFYPNFTSLRETFGDSKERVRWRTKQNLDYSFLMLYAQDKGTYYVQLEDDIVAKSNYYGSMKAHLTSLSSDQWFMLEFSQLGFIGKMFHSYDLPMIAEFFLMFHKDKPNDWLLDHIMWVKVCHPEKDAKDCSKQKSLLKLKYKPSLFQHVGLHSSLSGKIQNLKDKDFGKLTLFHSHLNPPAEVSSSLKPYQTHTLEKAYRGEDFFWGFTPLRGDHVLFHFTQPTRVTGYLFRTGNVETNGDKFYNTTVEVLPSDASVRDKLLTAGTLPSYQGSDGGFIAIGAFENGKAEGEIPAGLQPISALRLMVLSDSDVWVLLSEIFIKV